MLNDVDFDHQAQLLKNDPIMETCKRHFRSLYFTNNSQFEFQVLEESGQSSDSSILSIAIGENNVAGSSGIGSSAEPGTSKGSPTMNYFRGSKFAQILGFGGSYRNGGGEGFPVNMANLELYGPEDDGETTSPPQQPFTPPNMATSSSRTNVNLHATPLEPSFYQEAGGTRRADAQWTMNYQEAGIYLEEGDNNDQFSAHPKGKESLPAYFLAHTAWFYIVDLIAALVLIFLAFIEQPAVEAVKVPIGVHASLELGALAIIIFGLVLKLRWLGWKTIYRHHRTLLKAITLGVMIMEAVTVLIRQDSHFRVTRALRPIFLIDSKHLRGVRRFSRQCIQSLAPILDMLLLLMFFILSFTLLGHFLFSENPEDPFFRTFDDSFISLFVLLTTANFPDVMMPSYAKNPWSVLFFVAYIVTVLYLFMNLLLAVVYDTFTTIEKEKFRKLVIHKRKACNFAFNLLVSKSNSNGILFRHFYGTMAQYAPKKSLRDIYLTFRALNRTGNGVLSREEFYRFYEVSSLNWKPVRSLALQKQWAFFKEYGILAQNFLNSTFSNYLFNGLILLNSLAMLARWIEGQTSQESWDAYIFSILFLLEMGLKIVTWGFTRIISSGWNTFDLIATLVFFFSLIIVKFIPRWGEVLTFIRPLRLLRLFKLKKRYRNVFGTLFILLPPMTSVAIVMMLLYYFFAIIGMEIFSQVQLKNCCNGSMYRDYYVEPNSTGVSNSTDVALRYFLNSFEDILKSYVTLFELTVVNNWYIIMEGYKEATGNRYCRIYFITFYLVTMCLLTIIVAFILDTFLFRMQYKRAMDKKTEQKMLRTQVSLSGEEINFCYKHYTEDPAKRMEILQDYGEDLATRGCVNYVGSRRSRTKDILWRKMFKTEIAGWERESEENILRPPPIN